MVSPDLGKAALEGDHAKLVELVQAEAGGVVEVVRREHTHEPPGPRLLVRVRW